MNTMNALFAAGCFWGVQYYFDQVPGVIKTTVGYTGGHSQNPTYEQLCSGSTGHAEATLIEYDPAQISYEKLIRHFFRMHDPTQMNRQGLDIGVQYRSAIYYYTDEQKEAVVNLKNELQPGFDKPLATEIKPVTEFYPAEDYHQKFTERSGRGACHVPYKEL